MEQQEEKHREVIESVANNELLDSIPTTSKVAGVSTLILAHLQTIASLLHGMSLHAQQTFSEEEAAAYLHCSTGTLQRYSLRTRQIKFSIVGRARVYSKSDLDHFLQSVKR